jgi:gluconokinase
MKKWLMVFGAVLACSALKQTYRARLQRNQTDVRFVYLKGDLDLIRQRLTARQGHFMPADLLASQFATLEEPQGVLTVDISQSPESIVGTRSAPSPTVPGPRCQPCG